MARVKVTIFGAKGPGADEVGLLVVKVKMPVEYRGKGRKRQRRAFADGVAAGVVHMMAHIQPEGDGFPSWPQQ